MKIESSLSVGLRIQKARKRLGRTQQDVAKLLGVPRSAVCRIESGDRKISAEEIAKLAVLFGTTIDALAGHVDKEPIALVVLPNFDYNAVPFTC